MNFNSLQKRSYHFLLGLMLTITLVATVAENAYSQVQRKKPEVPVLSLTGGEGYDQNIYPDGRIWLPPSTTDGTREFLLPVFITNKWAYFSDYPDYVPDKIYSFQFKLLYDSTVFMAVGYEKDLHPTILPDLPLANKFTIDFQDKKDHSWKLENGKDINGEKCTNYGTGSDGKYTGYHYVRMIPCSEYSTLERGRVTTISGFSSQPLPNTSLTGNEYKVLIYVRFKVLAKGKAESPIVIDDRDIRYNDVNIRTSTPFTANNKGFVLGKTTRSQDQINDDYKIEFNTGLQGADNSLNPIQYALKPSRYGVIWVGITDNAPQFDMTSQRGGSIVRPQLNNVNDEFKLWILNDPITVDTKGTKTKSMPSGYTIGSRKLKLMNKISNTRMIDVKIESDQPWLEFRRVNASGASTGLDWTTTTDNWSFDNRIRGIDNNILGNVEYLDPAGNPTQLSDKFGPVYLEFRINKEKLTEVEAKNREGIYNGFISFSSPTALNSVVKLKVTGIVFKDPNEGGTATGPGAITGARVWVRNAKANGDDDTVMLVFGTGPRASAGVDTLYGEFAYPAIPAFGNINYLAARWFGVTDAQKAAYPNGLGDWLPNDEYNYSSSRDIRDEEDTTESLVYQCKFRRNSNDKNIIIEWDPNDFIPGSRCFLRDTQNGSIININMYEGTINPISGRHTYTSTDMNFNSFNIEYTPPRTISYLDENKQPIIKTGWNLLSLPVRPVTPDYKKVYIDAAGVPYEYNSTGFQQQENLVVGKGYFVKYAAVINSQFTGSIIRKIEYPNDEVLLYPDLKANQGGWNLIGGLSYPTSVNDISFTQYKIDQNYVIPTVNYTRKNGVWGYKTNKGYVQVTELTPGLGYFIKVDNYGYLKIIPSKLPAGRLTEEANNNNIAINVRDNQNKSTSIFLASDKSMDLSGLEMPPAFEGMFDVRFTNNYNVSNSDNSVFTLKGASYPVELTIENADADYTFVDAASKQVLGTIAKGTTSNVVIASARTSSVEVLKSNAATTEVYPNPSVNEVTVTLNQATTGAVTMSLVDMFGNTLDTQVAVKGTAKFNVSNLATGKYFCKIVSGDFNETVSVTVVR